MVDSAVSVGLAGLALFSVIVVIALNPDYETRRRSLGHALWGSIFVYLGAFSILSGRSRYSGSGDVVLESPLVGQAALIGSGVAGAIAVACLFSSSGGHKGRTTALTGAACTYLLAILVADGVNGLGLNVQVVFVMLLVVAVSALREPSEVVVARLKFWLRILLVISLAAVFVDPGWALVPPEFGGRAWLPTRLIGFTAATNYMALAAALSVLVELASRRSWATKIFVCLGVVECIWAQGRTGLLVLGVGLLAGWMVRKKRGAAAGTVLRVLGWTGIWVGVTFQTFVTNLIREEQRAVIDDFTTERLEGWGPAWDVFSANVISGYGSSIFTQDFWAAYPGVDAGYSNAHNQMLQALGQGGLIVGAGLLVLISTILKIAKDSGASGREGAVVLGSVIIAQLAFGTPLLVTGLSWNLIPLLGLVGVSSMPLLVQPQSVSDRSRGVASSPRRLSKSRS